MLKRWTTRLAVFLLRHVELTETDRTKLFYVVVDLCKNKSLNIEERQMLTAMLLDKLGALPLHAKIKMDKTGAVIVNGRPLNFEQAERLKQAATAMQNNAARNLVRESVAFMAIVDGVHKNISPEMGLFAKAALWWLQEEDALYALLAPEELGDD